ncbi:TetR/AcrR family transcriptional regulator [Pseudarthrobacter sp. C4D7]|uniref:TetR/AcrR family transcriptional regulator n=1 Tax=Pseudarthrobacter sp. C4D7 TaxID=2735268 RepID=UPI0015859FDF|nr:TetR/AcrR family transcriptional regulator [Pseudarthrobacter sp. C4D7]NUT73346.1 helix-turn-helix transcriptional regulator [Pseudarthrobacter sp. C4D7]
MSTPYHHGSLRHVLLEEGRLLLAERGVAAVTLRELARRAGVSHAAPLRHFSDREALLDAIAAKGFDELTAALESADVATDLHERLSIYSHTHVHFAVANAALMELMFSRDLNPRNGGAAAQSAARFFTLGALLLGESDPQALGPLPYLLTGMLEGISSLASGGRIPKDRVEEITAAAVEVMLPAIQKQLRNPHTARGE